MATGTNKPLGSTDPRDLAANAENLEAAVNDIVSLEWTDRFGRKRVTMHAVETAVPDAIAARDQAVAAADAATAASSAVPYNTQADLLASLAPGPTDEAWAVVTNDPAGANNGFYSWTGSSWEKSELQPAKAADVRGLQELISPSGITEPIEAVVDDEGGIHRLHTPTMIEDSVHRVEEIGDGAAILGEDGSIVLFQDETCTIVGPLHLAHTDQAGVYVVDEDGGVHAALAGEEPADAAVPTGSPLASGAFFSGVLAGAQGVPICLHTPSLLAERLRSDEVVATISSATNPSAISGSQVLRFQPDTLGANAQLTLRARTDAADRLVRPLVVKTVPVPATAPLSPQVLLIADSIGNRQGAFLLNQFLTQWGYSPSFVGTMRGSESPSNAANVAGPLGECREGWESGDYTNAVVERSFPIAAGGEAAYLAMPKIEQRDYNPFIRAATGSDPAEDVKNGYIVDFAFYQSRFSLQAPDVVIWALGTNDVRDRSAAEIYGVIKSNDALIYRRIKAAWPAAKIIRTLPGTAVDASREPLWSSKYIPLLRGMLDAAAGVADVTVAPAWAMVDHEAGYDYTRAPDATTGFTRVAALDDAVHPIGSARTELYQSLSAYVAAAALNLI